MAKDGRKLRRLQGVYKDPVAPVEKYHYCNDPCAKHTMKLNNSHVRAITLCKNSVLLKFYCVNSFP